LGSRIYGGHFGEIDTPIVTPAMAKNFSQRLGKGNQNHGQPNIFS
jgi:hypothetical protein